MVISAERSQTVEELVVGSTLMKLAKGDEEKKALNSQRIKLYQDAEKKPIEKKRKATQALKALYTKAYARYCIGERLQHEDACTNTLMKTSMSSNAMIPQTLRELSKATCLHVRLAIVMLRPSVYGPKLGPPSPSATRPLANTVAAAAAPLMATTRPAAMPAAPAKDSTGAIASPSMFSRLFG